MKRKLLAGLLATACATCLAFGLSACKKHTHTYATEWTIDGTYHWHAATCEHTDEISDKAEHGFAGGVCPVCKYERPVSEGLEYTLSDDGTYYIVTGIGTCTDTDIVIPSEHETLPVRAIESYAFWDASLTSIAIPDRVTSN